MDTAGRKVGEQHLHQANMSHDAALYGFRRKIFTIHIFFQHALTKVPAAAAAATASQTTSASAVLASGGDNVAPEESTGVGTTCNTLAPQAKIAREEVDGKFSTTNRADYIYS